MMKILILLSLLCPAMAFGFFADLNGLYVSDSLSATSESSISRMYGDFAFGMNIDKKGQFTIGWSLLSIATTDSNSEEISFSTFDMGPKFGYFIDRSKYWSVALTYNLQARATYSAGDSEATWRGTSIKLELGYAPMITETIYGGLKLNYYATTLTEEFDANNNYAEIDNSRTVLWPSIFVSYRLD